MTVPGLNLPTVGADDGTWGAELNAAVAALNTATKAADDAEAAARVAADTALDGRLDTVEQAVASGTSVAAWTANTDYLAGQLVTYLGALYQRKTNGSSGPLFDVAMWNVLTSVQSYDSGSTPPDAPGVTYIAVSAATGADTTPPTVPTNLVATPSSGQVALTWTASTDAVGVTGYRVRRGGVIVGSPVGTAFTDTGLNNGTQYSYTVSAVDAAGNESAQTAPVLSTPQAGASIPSQVTGLSATPGDSSVSLSWTAPSANGSAITDYVVQRRTLPGGSFATISDGVSTATAFTDTGLTNGTGYEYQVAAVNGVGQGTYSAAVSATPVAAASITQVNKAGNNANGATSVTTTLPAAPVVGNKLIGVFRTDSLGSFTAADMTPPAGWTKVAAVKHTVAAQGLMIAVREVQSGDSASVQWTAPQSGNLRLNLLQYAGLQDSDSNLLAAAEATSQVTGSNVTSLTVGPTGTLSQAATLAIVAITGNGLSGAFLSFSDGFTLDETSDRMGVGSKVTSSTAAVQTTGTWTTARQPLGLLVTLKGA